MKLLAIISILGMTLLGFYRFHSVPSIQHADTHAVCSMDCCGEDGACCSGSHQESGEEAPDTQDADQHQTCSHNCDCNFTCQLVAIGFYFFNGIMPPPESVHFAEYHNGYHYDYLAFLLEPPRMG
jgi:hypothetical protein